MSVDGTDTTPAAIMNAIYDAIGVQVRRMPAFAQRVLQAVRHAADTQEAH